MSSLLPVYIDVIIGEHGTPHRGNADGLLLQSQFLDDFGYQLMYHSVGAPGAVMHVVVVHELRLGMYQVLRAYYLIFIHTIICWQTGR
ncbi:hypothetical protein SDC9_193768 [bioreactor metagenome]|uniref:Uncharacterized protein n=1 Tax=bioreactor metagenome TaxID=1076179 RepID=A0A645I4E9_9ZZZZ